MATTSIGMAVLELSASTARISADLGKALNSIDRFKRNAEKALATVGVGIGVGAFAAFIKGSIDAADALNDLSKRTGLAGNELLAIQSAALKGGSSLDAVSDIASKLPARLAEAAKGTGDTADALKALDLKATDASGNLRSVGDIMQAAGDKFAEFSDGPNKAAIAIALFGRGGDKLIPVIEGLREARDRLKELGVTVDQKLLTSADKFNDLMVDMGAVSAQLGRNITSLLLPALTTLATDLLNGQVAAQSFFGGLALYATTSNADVGGQIKQISGTLEKLKQQREDLSKDTLANRINNSLFSDLADTNTQIDVLTKKLQFLKSIQRRQALDLGADIGRDEASRFAIPLKQAPRLPGKPTKDVGISFDELLAKASMKRLEELDRAEKDAAAASEQLQHKLDGLISNTTIEKAKNLSDNLDVLKGALADGRINLDTYAEAVRNMVGATDDVAEHLKKISDAADRLISDTPIEKSKELQEILDELSKRMAAGVITSEQYQHALDDLLGTTKDKAEKVNDVARDLGLTFSSAFEDAIAGGKSFRSILSGIEQDLLRIGTRKLVTEPFGNFLTEKLKDFDISKIFSGGGGSSGTPFGPNPDGSNLLPEFAMGSDFIQHDMIARLHKGERVVTASENRRGGSGGSSSVVINFAITGAVDSRSQTQIAAVVSDAVRRAQRNR